MFTRDKEFKELFDQLFDNKPALIEAKVDGNLHAETKIGCTREGFMILC